MEAEKKIKELIDDSRTSGRKIIYIQHINPPDDYFFIEGTDGVKISDRIQKAFLAALDGVFATII